MRARASVSLSILSCVVLVAACGDDGAATPDAPLVVDATMIDGAIDAPVMRTVTLTVTGPGTVTSVPAGISCPGTCTASVIDGTQLVLTAVASGSVFAGWSGGGCSGTGTCTITASADTAITAMFTPTYTLTVVKAGTGTGTVTATGIDCGVDCDVTGTSGTSITLSAAPDVGSTFAGWSGGGCSGTGTCVVTLAAATTVTATFTLEQYALTVALAGNGSGTVTSSPAGISCAGDCSESYDHGTVVTLTPAAATGSTFTGWAGACTGTGTCVVTLTAASSVTATFTLDTYALTVVLAGIGTGAVASSPAGIACGGDCTETYDHGTIVTLTATANALQVFTGWSGGGCSSTGTCVVTLTAATTVTATFNQQNIAFVTSTSNHTGNLGGLAGADAICQARAQAASLPGTYRAWLSTTTTTALSRLGTATGWVRPDNKPVVHTPADLVAGKMFHPLRITETGVDVGDTFALTTTTTTGGLHGASTTCDEFTTALAGNTVVSGSTAGIASAFTVFNFSNCAQTYRLYCFGIDHTNPLPRTPPPAYRRAFISSGAWTPGGGLDAADGVCAADATAASLPGTYRAMLATSSNSAESRFVTTGDPWARVDGVLLAPTAAELFSSASWQTGLNVLASGTYMSSGNTGVWGGASSLTAVGSSGLTCGGTWSSNAGTGGGGRNGFSVVSRLFANDTMNSCGLTVIRLICLQQ